jgi:hypothetical protein
MIKNLFVIKLLMSYHPVENIQGIDLRIFVIA